MVMYSNLYNILKISFSMLNIFLLELWLLNKGELVINDNRIEKVFII